MTAALLMAVRRFRDGRAPLLGLAVLVLVTAACAAAAPRLLDRFADDALRGAVAGASPFDRNVQLIQERRYEADTDDPMARVAEAGERLEAQMPPDVPGLFGRRIYVVDTFRWSIVNDTPDPSFLRLRIQQGAEDEIVIVEGRAPTAATRTIVEDRPDPEEDLEITVLEAALSVESLDAIDMAVGDTLRLTPDENDRLVGRGGVPEENAVDIVGVFEVADPDGEYWLDDTALVRPSIRSIGDARLYDLTGLISAAAYGELLTATRLNHNPFRYSFQFLTDVDGLESEELTAILPDLRRLESTFPATGGVGVEAGTGLRSGLLPLLEAQQAGWAAAVAVLAVVGLGPAAVGVAALALVAVFVMQRRRPALALGRARGASAGQLVGAVLVEGLLLSLPPAALAAALVWVLLPGGPNLPTAVGAAIVAGVTTLLLLAAGAPVAVAQPRAPGREASFLRRPSPRRLALEALVVVLAVGGAYLLRERGVRGTSSAAELAGADPFVAAVPALAGLAAGILAVRLLPLPMLLLSRLAAVRRDLVPVLALRRVTRGGTSGPVLIVLMATATIGTFGGATLVHLDRGAEAVAWQEIGAPYRLTLESGPLPADLDPLELPGVQVAAGQIEVSTVLATRFLPLQMIALDAGDHASVVAATGGDPRLPRELLAPTATEPLPAIASRQLTTGPEGIAVGGTFQLVVEGYPVTFRIVEVRDSYPTMAANQTFVIASRTQLRALRSDAALRATTALYLRAPETPEAAAAIREALRRSVPGARLESRAERTAAIRSAPIVESLVAGVAAAAAVAIAYAALAVTAALALAGAARAVEVAHLRTLGLTRREALGLVVVEHGPTIVVAFVAGAALGIALFGLLRDSLGLSDLVGAEVDVAVGIDPGQLAAVLAAVVIIVALGIVLGAALQRAATPAAAVRRGFE
jgi:putative ABC transport system permease protein